MASNNSNWTDNRGRAISQTTLNNAFLGSNKFYAKGQYIDLAGTTLGNCTFDNDVSTTANFVNSGTITFSNVTLPIFAATNPCNYSLANSGTKLTYNVSGTSSQAISPHSSPRKPLLSFGDRPQVFSTYP